MRGLRRFGSHYWKWWNQEFGEAVQRGLFTPPPVTETSQLPFTQQLLAGS